jgi:hypothetical protein
MRLRMETRLIIVKFLRRVKRWLLDHLKSLTRIFQLILTGALLGLIVGVLMGGPPLKYIIIGIFTFPAILILIILALMWLGGV